MSFRATAIRRSHLRGALHEDRVLGRFARCIGNPHRFSSASSPRARESPVAQTDRLD